MAKKSESDPTVTGASSGPEYPEGTHPAAAPSDQAYAPDRFTYKDNPDKPDPSSVAQLVTGPLPGDPK